MKTKTLSSTLKSLNASTSGSPTGTHPVAGEPMSETLAAIPDLAGAAALAVHAPGELLVQFQSGTGAVGRAKALAAVSGQLKEVLWSEGPAADAAQLVRVTFNDSLPTAKAIEALMKQASVKFAEPNYTVQTQATSNDAYFTDGKLWGMRGDGSSVYGSRADNAWGADLTGSTKTVVGVIDSGIDYRHPDLYLNVWLNQGEIPSGLRSVLQDVDSDGLITFRDLNYSVNQSYVTDINKNGYIDAADLLNDARWEDGIDTDGNGYRDDLIGWDFVNGDNDPLDDNNHGTHVAGSIGGMGGNGTGVVGVNWSTQLVPLKFLSATGSGSTANALKALDYYTQVSKSASAASDFVGTNNSWGGGGFSQSMLDAIVRTGSAGNLFVAAAGNGGSDGIGDDNDATPSYPSNYSTQAALGWDAVVAVAALTSTGALASFSNFGNTSVDLAAPGAGIWSTLPNGGYGSASGTSMAAPHVMGALALIAAAMPGATPQQMLDTLKKSVTAKTDLASKLAWDGWLDLSKLASAAIAPAPTPASTLLYGTDGSDTLVGTTVDEVLSGVPASSSLYGRGTVDVLAGGGGKDVLVLGASGRVFYDDGNSRSAGSGDYARITDFVAGQDKVQLAGGRSYVAGTTTINGTSGLAIYWDTNGNRKLDTKSDEMIGFLAGIRSISSDDIIYST